MKRQNKDKITCSIVGARGYAGLELARILLRHPNANLVSCFATSEFKLADHLGMVEAAKVQCYTDSEVMKHLTDVVFLATPAEVSLKLAPQIIGAGKKVIDLSGAFRLKKHDYPKWYGFEHTQTKLLAEAQYGLSPWVGPAGQQSLVANPGCFATAITLALIPLLKSDLIFADGIVIDAKSGSSGAGKKAAENLLFTEVDGECLPYKVGKHQHLPEILEAVEAFTSRDMNVHFSTSLLPVRRGIIAGIYAKAKAGVVLANIEKAFNEAYQDYNLVRFGSLMKNPSLLSLKKVVGTARTHIGYEMVDDRVYVYSCIDNLLKGAASQAVENFNRLSDLPVSTGVSEMEALT